MIPASLVATGEEDLEATEVEAVASGVNAVEVVVVPFAFTARSRVTPSQHAITENLTGLLIIITVDHKLNMPVHKLTMPVPTRLQIQHGMLIVELTST